MSSAPEQTLPTRVEKEEKEEREEGASKRKKKEVEVKVVSNDSDSEYDNKSMKVNKKEVQRPSPKFLSI